MTSMNHPASSYAKQMLLLLESMLCRKRSAHHMSRDLQLAICLADHTDVKAHNQVAKEGAVALWCRFLIHHSSTLLCRGEDEAGQSPSSSCLAQEVQQMCLLLFLLLQCSDECAAKALEPVACDLVIHLLRLLLVDDHHNNTKSHKKNNWAKSVLHRIGRVKLNVCRMTRGEQLVRSLQQILRDDERSRAAAHLSQEAMRLLDGLASHPESRLSLNDERTAAHMSQEAMRLLDGLASHPESRLLLVKVPGLVRDVVGAATVHPCRCVPTTNQTTTTTKGCWWSSACATLDFLIVRFLRKLAGDARNQLRLSQTHGAVPLLLACAQHASLEIQKEATGCLSMLSHDKASVQVLWQKSGNEGALVHDDVLMTTCAKVQHCAACCRRSCRAWSKAVRRRKRT